VSPSGGYGKNRSEPRPAHCKRRLFIFMPFERFASSPRSHRRREQNRANTRESYDPKSARLRLLVDRSAEGLARDGQIGNAAIRQQHLALLLHRA